MAIPFDLVKYLLCGFPIAVDKNTFIKGKAGLKTQRKGRVQCRCKMNDFKENAN
jgi:hypothetical protein